MSKKTVDQIIDDAFAIIRNRKMIYDQVTHLGDGVYAAGPYGFMDSIKVFELDNEGKIDEHVMLLEEVWQELVTYGIKHGFKPPKELYHD